MTPGPKRSVSVPPKCIFQPVCRKAEKPAHTLLVMIIGAARLLLQAFNRVKFTAFLPQLPLFLSQDYVSLFKDFTVRNKLCAILTPVSS